MDGCIPISKKKKKEKNTHMVYVKTSKDENY
jgi:hypothetical protein